MVVVYVQRHGQGKFVHHLDTLVYNTWLRSNSPYLSTRFDFQHYVFSYSGASGGTMGAAVLCAQRYAQLTDKPYHLTPIHYFSPMIF